MTRPGAPAWVDLPTTEPDAVRDFYTGLFGWQCAADPDRPHYTVARAGGLPVAGIYEPTATSLPSIWTLYLACESVRAVATRIPELGGQVVLPPAEIMGIARILVVRDPTGAVVGLWESDPGWEFAQDRAGAQRWAELNTRDGTRADAFYADLLGYRQQQIGGNVDYTAWYLDDTPVLGRHDLSSTLAPEVPSHWLIYFKLDPDQSTDGAAERAVGLGGRVLRDPADSPHGRVALLQDVVGATFSIIDTSRRSSA
jgi:uncharacterized protein